MVSNIWYAGKNSRDFGIRVEYCPPFSTGTVDVSKVSIPGRNGDLVLSGVRRYTNYTQEYEIWFQGEKKDTILDAQPIAAWLLSGQGYARLEDSYDPFTYRMALFTGPLDVDNWMLRRGRATISFDCMPQRWLKSGEQPISVKTGQTLRNGWQPALPLIQISGTGNGVLSVGSSIITINGMDGALTIDSDTQDAYSGTVNKNNSIIVSGGFPVLQPGDTAITFSGGITAVQITPRWWTL